ncbi:MAG: fumarylacetoacetate hydrolase family protein [Lachnospiraceae bacterium]|nr:fumarylacetoacetate hydrolase family protein [Lachnospiraceae bacterium]
MRYYTLKHKGVAHVAASEDGKRAYILRAYLTMNIMLIKGHDGNIPGLAEAVDLASPNVEILSPIPHPRQDVICLGINYADHAKEAEGFDREAFSKEKPDPIFFSKRVSYSQGTGDVIPLHGDICDSLDYEAELGVVIGKEAYNVKAADALDHIFGYTVINDVSARNLQTRHKQWYFGKSLDGFTPMGPCIVSKDEFDGIPELDIRTYVNGELRQSSNTRNLITGIPEIIEILSSGMTLAPGTVIATGTPSGVAMGMDPPVFLKDGDEVACEIDNIGRLVNTVSADPDALARLQGIK